MSHRTADRTSGAAARPDRAPRGPVAAELAGRLLAAASAIGARLRRSRRPLHPKGALYAGALTRTGSDPAWGVPWLDTPGTAEVVVRLSRSAGLPAGFPDVNGIAIRLLDGGGDLLLSNTGSGRLTRFLLMPRRSVGGTHSTLVPFRTAAGPLLVRADLAAVDDRGERPRTVDRVRLPVTMTLSAAAPRGPWRPFAHLTLTAPAGPVPDPPIAFDPGDAPPGLATYPWVRSLRTRSYAAARAVRASS
jgi:hypothetical protein